MRNSIIIPPNLGVPQRMSAIASRADSPDFWNGYKFISKNTKLIDICDNANYGTGAGTQSADDTNFVIQNYNGTGALKILENDNSASWIYSSRAITAKDLTKFDDTSASDTSDNIDVIFYISDATKFDNGAGRGVQIALGTDNAWTNFYSYNYLTFATGLNYAKIPKSAFGVAGGTPNWNNIGGIYLAAYTKDNAQNAFVSFNVLMLMRNVPITT